MGIRMMYHTGEQAHFFTFLNRRAIEHFYHNYEKEIYDVVLIGQAQ